MTTDFDTLFIGGEWIQPQGSERIDVRSPSTEEFIGSVPKASRADVDAAVTSAQIAGKDRRGWAGFSPSERADVMERLASELDSLSADIAESVSTQNGMPIAISQQLEAVFSPAVLRYYARLIRGRDEEETRPGLFGGSSIVRRSPVGVVAAIVPWNFPQTLASFKIAPALAAGCTLVIKPSPETVLDSYVLAKAIEKAGIPSGVINIVPGGREVGAYLVAHPGINKVAFTGSTPAGRDIGAACGRLLRPVTLELGGKSAAVVLDDVDVDSFLANSFGATMLNNGQTCFLNSRILAPASRYDEIVDGLTAFAGALSVGDALDPGTQVGPMVSAVQRDRVERYIGIGAAEGGRITVGGGRPAGLDRGWFVEPTVFADVANSATIAQEEIFGPVLSVISYWDVDEAVQIANDSEYGLGGSVWTTDHGRGVDVARRIETGTIGINGYLPDPTAPFGGAKASGLGRELGPEGLAPYEQLQSIYL